MQSLKNLAIAFLVVLAIILVVQNTESVETRFLFATAKMPRAFLLFVTLVTGVVIGLLMGHRRRKGQG